VTAEHGVRELDGGRTVAYTVWRSDSDERGAGAAPLVLLHGWGSAGRDDWSAVVEALGTEPATAGRTILGADMPGHGESSAGGDDSGTLTVAGYVDAVADIMAAEGLADAIAIGHSLGGTMAVELAVRHPGLVSRIIGVDTFHYLQVYPRQDEDAVHAFADGFSSDPSTAVAALVELSSTPSTPESMKEYVRATTLAAARRPAVVGLLVDGLRWDLDAALDELARRDPAPPVTAIVAELLLSSASRNRYADRIRFALFPDRGHYFPMEDPVGTARAIATEIG
jgi:pimeloyl-ACP methyl ester carboxylesterase